MNQQQVKTLYQNALSMALKQQVPTLVVCTLLLDGGRILRVCLIAMLGFWLFALLCLARSTKDSDPIGLWFLRWGFFPLIGVLVYVNDILHPITHR
jgi:hypothetical protein